MIASSESVVNTEDNLIANDTPQIATGVGTLITGQNLVRGAVLGKITRTLGATTANGSNTGNGTVTGAAMGENALNGTYTLTCTAIAANGGTFSVTAPDGDALPDASVGSAYANEQINFTINDGATDFALGDSFTIAIDAGSNKLTAAIKTAVDGSNKPNSILVHDIDASLADKACQRYVAGCFHNNELTWDASFTAAEQLQHFDGSPIVLR